MLTRRQLLTISSAASAVATARAIVAADVGRARLGICAFSCHQHWQAVARGGAGVKFTDAASFYRYARELGADGVQTPLRGTKPSTLRALVESDGGYFEGDVRLPASEADVPAFEAEIIAVRAAGAAIARAVLMGGRRYEVFATLEAFRAFQAKALHRLQLAEPVMRRHRVQLAIENHKDLTTDELVDLMKRMSSEWLGVLVDTGNNIALLEEPQAVVAALAPYALSVHLKDMALQPTADGFLLSEVPLGTGCLDLGKMVRTLRAAKPDIALNLEMATRDPLRIPCQTAGFFTTMPQRRATHLAAALQRLPQQAPRGPVPSVTNKPQAQVLAEEEQHNQQGLSWMHERLLK